jgi:8-oxo-dGTP pyrophosphatase MutT (NUDIX family)
MPHIHEKIDFVVEVFVVHKNKILLRKHEKYGIWLGAGGHIELDEDPNQAALREVKEEVGLDIRLVSSRKLFSGKENEKNYHELVPPEFLNRHQIGDTHEHVAFIYFAQSETDKLVLEKADDECQWLTKEEVERAADIKPSIKFYALRALQELAD